MKDKTGKKLSLLDIIGKMGNRIGNILLELELFVLRIIDFIPSHHVRLLFYRIAGVHVGRGSRIHMGVKFYDPSGIQIGKDSIIGEGTILDGRAKLVIGDHVDIASEVMIYNSEHDVHSDDFSPITEEVSIGDYVFIGPRAIIQPGITIGKGAIVAAGAVVTKNVGELEIVGGVPAKPIGSRKVSKLHYQLGRARLFR